jgi:teichuronic acid biosynthesis glycosyltransferase TuaC
MRALVVTNMYPTEATPGAGSFVAAQVESLRKLGIDIDVLHLRRLDAGRRVYRNLADRVRRLVAAHDPELVHVAYGGVMAATVTAAVRDRPVLVTFHGSDVLGGRGTSLVSTLSRRVGVLASRRAAHRAAGIIAVSQNVLAAIPSNVDRSRVWLVPNGVDLERFQPRDKLLSRQRLGWDSTRRHVLFPSSPDRPEKRYHLACAAVNCLLEQGVMVDLHVLDRVPYDEVALWLNAADAIVLTSAHEGSPVVVKEALACDVPVVSVDVGDVRERIDGVEGCSIAEPTPEDLARNLRRTLEFDGPIGGRSRVADASLELTAERVRDIYALLTNHARRLTSGPAG